MELRCPFCHDVVEPPAGVPCWSCDAIHHPDCFLENEGCAATACGEDRVRAGAAAVGLEELARLGEEPGAFEELARRSASRSAAWELAGRLAAVVLLLALVPPAWGLLGPVGLLLWSGLLVVVLLATSAPARATGGAVPRPPEASFDPIFGQWSAGGWTPGVLPDAGKGLREQLRRSGEEAPPPALEGPPPEVCPHCERQLEWEEGEPATSFCYHCGGALNEPAADPLTAAPPPPHPPATPRDPSGGPAKG